MDFSKALPAPSSLGGLGDFDAAAVAAEYEPLPAGIYNARVAKGEVSQTKAGADAYRVKFEIADGPQAGKTVVRTWTFTPKAIPYAKRDLAPFGLTTSAALLSPFPSPGKDVYCRLVVALQTGDDGIERNDIKRIDQIRFADSPAARFMLPNEAEGGPK